MPRLKTPDNTARAYLFRVPVARLARKVGWCKSTSFERKKQPGKITLDELAVLVRENEVTEDELYKLVTMR